MISQLELDELWDFEDPAGSEQRLREAAETDSENTGELMTQVARALGLQQAYDDARALLARIDQDQLPPVVRVRIELERGRIDNSAGLSDRAIPHFDAGRELAAEHGLDFLHIDALHMLAIADPERTGHWTAEGILAAEATPDDRARRWLISLHNNHGWTLFDNADLIGAAAEFERAAEWAEQVGTAEQQQAAGEALDEARTALRRQSGWLGA